MAPKTRARSLVSWRRFARLFPMQQCESFRALVIVHTANLGRESLSIAPRILSWRLWIQTKFSPFVQASGFLYIQHSRKTTRMGNDQLLDDLLALSPADF